MTPNNIFDLSDILDKIRAIALEGAKYAKDPYDIARYQKLLDLSGKEYAQKFDYDLDKLKNIFSKSIGSTTPKLGVDAAVINQNDQILLLQRSDDKSWCLPCGWVDVGEGPAEAAVRETFEETGLIVEPKAYISISKKGPSLASHLMHQVNIITVMKRIASNTEIKLSHEHLDFKWVSDLSEVSECHLGHQKQIKKIISYIISPERSQYIPLRA